MKKVSSWVRPLLLGGALFNLVLAVFLILIPGGSHQFLFGGAPFMAPQALQVWGILLASLGVGYAVVGLKPLNNTVVLLMGILANFLFALVIPTVADGLFWQYTSVVLWELVALLWVGALGVILSQVAKARKTPKSRAKGNTYQEPVSKTLSRFRTQRGKNLLQLSHEQPTLLVFLRPFTSALSSKLLEDIRQQRTEIENKGSQIVLVHEAETAEARDTLKAWGLAGLHHISDPNAIVYKAFGLKSSGNKLLMFMKALVRRLVAGAREKQLTMAQQSKGLTRAGIFLLNNGEIVRSYRHSYVSPRPNYRRWISEEAA